MSFTVTGELLLISLISTLYIATCRVLLLHIYLPQHGERKLFEEEGILHRASGGMVEKGRGGLVRLAVIHKLDSLVFKFIDTVEGLILYDTSLYVLTRDLRV